MGNFRYIFQNGAQAVLAVVALAVLFSTTPSQARDDSRDQEDFLKNIEAFVKGKTLPPAKGHGEPLVVPSKGEDHLWHQNWFLESFLNLRDDLTEASEQGKRFVIVFEQRGCGYCIKMHKQILAQKYINDYVRENFTVLQLDLWGNRNVTDFDGKEMTEKDLAKRWGVIFTPTLMFFTDDLSGSEGKTGAQLEVARMPGAFGPNTFYDLFTWGED